jgi:eukaryotic-like serine/threonine-protein kinase
MGDRSHPDARVRPQLGLPDRYEAVRHIASGGMASVWCARDRALGRNVAIKLLAERFADDPAGSERFTREARAAARLSGHPNVVMIYDVGETDESAGAPGRAFIVMEYLAGGTVADALRVDSVRRVHTVKWIHEAAAAVDYGHERGVLHRDIKPANLLLDRDRVLHVADFGIARLGTEDTITGTDQVLGTASYLAPERALGRPATEASDRYSLAVAAYELLVGERPFTSAHFAAQARQHVEDKPPAASERNRALPPAVDAVLARGMAKRPEQRWPSAQDFAQAIEAALTETATRTYRAGGARAGAAAGAGAGAAGAAAAVGGGRAARPAAAVGAGRAARTAPRARPVGAGRPRRGTGAPEPGTGTTVALNRRRRRFRGARVPALAALAAGAGVAIAIAGTIGSGGSSGTHSASAGTQREASAATLSHKPPAPPHKQQQTTTRTASTVTATPAAATTPAPLAETLEARGHQLMVDGNYSAAIPVLQQAVTAASPGSLTYAYALYDLGRSLRLAGDPADAAKVLYQRLQIPNQTGTVRAQLQLALLALGDKARSGGAGAGPGAGPGPGKHHGHLVRGGGPPGGGPPGGGPPAGDGSSQGD